jgi:hypothetical protein
MNDRYQLRGVRIGAVIAVAAVAAFLVWFFAIRDTGDDNGGGGAPKAGQDIVPAMAATEADLSDLASKDDHPIFWAGDQPGTSDLELTQTADGNVYVRYLTGNAPIDTPKPSYLTVGTYPFPDAYHALKVVADEPGAVTKDVADGGLAVTNTNSPTSVYLAYPDQEFQVEVYDPDPTKALDLVTSGDIQPVP